MFPPADTRNPAAIAALVEEKFTVHFPGESVSWFQRIFRDVETIFVREHVMAASNYTSPLRQQCSLQSRNVTEPFIGNAPATANDLGQMSAPDYPDEPGLPYAELNESDDYLNVPLAACSFRWAEDLASLMAEFWRTLVLPKLKHEFAGADRSLSILFFDGRNPCLDAAARDIALIEQRVAAFSPNAG